MISERFLMSVSQNFDVLSTFCGRKYVHLDVIQNTLSLSSLLGSLSFTFTSYIHLTILASAHWSATSFSFLTGQVSLPCNTLLRTQLLSSLPHLINGISRLVSNGTNCVNLFHQFEFWPPRLYSASPTTCYTDAMLVHGQVTIIFVVSVGLSVCLFVCAELFSAVFDPISIKVGHVLYVCRVGFLPAETCFCRTWGLNRFKPD